MNLYGHLMAESWRWLADQYQYVELDEWVVMPNHFHGIVVLSDGRRGGSRTAPTRSTSSAVHRKPLGRLIGAFKTVSTKKINNIHDTPGDAIWQRNYYEHVIRGEDSLRSIREYIVNNPANWEFDELNNLNQR